MKVIKTFEEFVNESADGSISQEAVYIHQMTGSGQVAAQNFIDDNNLDGSLIVNYIRGGKSLEIYQIRDLIAGVGSGAQKLFRQRMLKSFKKK